METTGGPSEIDSGLLKKTSNQEFLHYRAAQFCETLSNAAQKNDQASKKHATVLRRTSNLPKTFFNLVKSSNFRQVFKFSNLNYTKSEKLLLVLRGAGRFKMCFFVSLSPVCFEVCKVAIGI